MDATSRLRFRAISESLSSIKNRKQKDTTACMRVLNETIRPAIILASEEIKGSDLEFNYEDSEPGIKIGWTDQRVTFSCNGDTVVITTRVNGLAPLVDVISTEAVSEELVVDYIARFFKMAFNLPSPASR